MATDNQIGLIAVLDINNFIKNQKIYVSSIATMQSRTTSASGKLNNSFTSVGSSIGSVASIASGALVAGFAAAATAGLALAGGIIAIGVSSVKVGATLQQSVADIRSVFSGAKPSVDDLNETILALGVDPGLKVSATEAAQSIELLARNGLEWSEIAGGAARNSILLANATGADFGGAADVVTDVMAQFNIEAGNMGDAVNGITSVVTNSKFSFDDYRLAISQSGGVASQVGVSFKDFNTSIAATSFLFNSGSDAGTSFKTFLTTLVPKSKEAASELRNLGLFTGLTGAEFEKVQAKIEKTKLKIDALDPSSKSYQSRLSALQSELTGLQTSLVAGNSAFFDQQGNMESMDVISQALAEATAGLSDEQKNNAFSTIFGTDAMRTAFGLVEAGQLSVDGLSTEFQSLQATMSDTSAAEAVAIRNDTLLGIMEKIGDVIETTQASIHLKLEPALRLLADTVLSFVTKNQGALLPLFERIGNFLEKNIPAAAVIAGNVFTNILLPAFQSVSAFLSETVLPIIRSFVSSFSSGVGGLGSDVSFIMTSVLIPAFSALTGFISTVVVQGIKNLRDAWDNDLVPAFMRVQAFINNTLRPSFEHLSNVFSTVLGPSFDKIVGIITQNLLPGFDGLNNSVGTNIINAVDVVEENWPKIEKFIQDTMFFIRDEVIPRLSELKIWFDTNWPIMKDAVDTAWTTIQSVIETVVGVITEKIIPRLSKILTNIQNTMDELGIDWGDVWTAVTTAITVAGGLIALAGLVIVDTALSLTSAFTSAFGNITEGWQTLSGLFTTKSDLIKEIIGNLSLFVSNIFSGDFDAAFENAKTIFTAWVDSVTTNLAIVETLFDISFGTILEFVGTFIEDFVGFFVDLSDDLVGHSVIPDMMRDIISSISTGFSDIILDTIIFVGDMISELLGGNWLSIGGDIIGGVTLGIQNKTSEMVRAVTNAANSALSTFKSILDINSPAGAFIPPGQAIPEGVEVGVTRGIPAVIAATTAMGKSAITGAETGLSTPTGASGLMQTQNALTQPSSNTSLPQPAGGLGGGGIEALLGSLLSALGNQSSGNTVTQQNTMQVNNGMDLAVVQNVLTKSLVDAVSG